MKSSSEPSEIDISSLKIVDENGNSDLSEIEETEPLLERVSDIKITVTECNDQIEEMSDEIEELPESPIPTSINSAESSDCEQAIVDKKSSNNGSSQKSVVTKNQNESSSDDTECILEHSIESKATEFKKFKSPQQQQQVRRKQRGRSESLRQSTGRTTCNDSNEYDLIITNKQRKYILSSQAMGKMKMPTDDCEIFCSNIPTNVLESELIPLFDRFGKIWNLRLQMSVQNSNQNAGFAFVRFMKKEAADEAVKKLNQYEIVPGKHLMVRASQPNLSLFVGNIHRGLTREQIHSKLSQLAPGLKKTFVKNSYYEESKNCGFCFLEFDSNAAAFRAKAKLTRTKVWGRQLFIDWSQRSNETKQESKTLFINCLPKTTTAEILTSKFTKFGDIDGISLIKDYAFIKFRSNDSAMAALSGVQPDEIGDETTVINLARKRPQQTHSLARNTRTMPLKRFSRRPLTLNKSRSSNTLEKTSNELSSTTGDEQEKNAEIGEQLDGENSAENSTENAIESPHEVEQTA